MSRVKKSGAIAAAVTTVFIGVEGLKLYAYRDPATKGYPWTACVGETRLPDGSPIKQGMTFTLDQCKTMLINRADQFATVLERCVPSAVDMPAQRYVAHLSLAYNIGTGAYCKSSVARLQNGGYVREACDAFLKWNRAAGMVMRGLTNRREHERSMCLEGL